SPSTRAPPRRRAAPAPRPRWPERRRTPSSSPPPSAARSRCRATANAPIGRCRARGGGAGPSGGSSRPAGCGGRRGGFREGGQRARRRASLGDQMPQTAQNFGSGNQAAYILGTDEGWDAFGVVRWHAVEEISHPYRYEITLQRDATNGPVDINGMFNAA